MLWRAFQFTSVVYAVVTDGLLIDLYLHGRLNPFQFTLLMLLPPLFALMALTTPAGLPRPFRTRPSTITVAAAVLYGAAPPITVAAFPLAYTFMPERLVATDGAPATPRTALIVALAMAPAVGFIPIGLACGLANATAAPVALRTEGVLRRLGTLAEDPDEADLAVIRRERERQDRLLGVRDLLRRRLQVILLVQRATLLRYLAADAATKEAFEAVAEIRRAFARLPAHRWRKLPLDGTLLLRRSVYGLVRLQAGRATSLGTSDSLAEAIDLLREMMRIDPQGAPVWRVLLAQYRIPYAFLAHDVTALHAGIADLRALLSDVDDIGEADPAQAEAILLLAQALLLRHRLAGGDAEAVQDSIALLRALPAFDGLRQERLWTLAYALAIDAGIRFDAAGYGEALVALDEAFAETPDDPAALDRVSSTALATVAAFLDLALVMAFPDLLGLDRDALNAVGWSGETVLDRLIEITEVFADVNPGMVSVQGLLNAIKSDRHGDPALAHRTMEALRGVVANPAAEISDRIVAARQAGTLAVRQGDWAAASADFGHAVRLLPRTLWRGQLSTDRYRVLSDLVGELACDAAAVELGNGAPERALEVLEQGRLVAWSQALHEEIDLEPFRGQAPDHVERLERALAEWARLVRGASAPADRRIALAAELDAAIADLSAAVGRDLAAGPRADELLAAGDEGPVVIVNASNFRRDALVIAERNLTVLPLPELDLDRLRDEVRELRDAVAKAERPGGGLPARLALEARIAHLLAWLWDAVAAPVLDLIGPADRVWWCPTGQLALLPLHAAGHHHAGDGRTVIDRVASSYALTLTSLLRARNRPPTGPAHRRLLAVAAPGTPPVVPLRHAAAEAAACRERVGDGTVLGGDAATREAVLGELSAHAWAHFACHGTAAGLLLAGDRPLTVLDVADLRLRHGELAVLSACHTAAGSASMPDEAMHLAGAMHMAGYRHVVGTLWTIPDTGRTATAFAGDLYDQLGDGTGQLDVSRTGPALHDVVRRLRDHDPRRLSTWASYVHIGP